LRYVREVLLWWKCSRIEGMLIFLPAKFLGYYPSSCTDCLWCTTIVSALFLPPARHVTLKSSGIVQSPSTYPADYLLNPSQYNRRGRPYRQRLHLIQWQHNLARLRLQCYRSLQLCFCSWSRRQESKWLLYVWYVFLALR
jgi:hypothetical protein